LHHYRDARHPQRQFLDDLAELVDNVPPILVLLFVDVVEDASDVTTSGQILFLCNILQQHLQARKAFNISVPEIGKDLIFNPIATTTLLRINSYYRK
jgi:hypothetical protein